MEKEVLLEKIKSVQQVCEWQDEILDYQMGVKKKAREYYNNILDGLRDIDKGINDYDLICDYVNKKTLKIKFYLDLISILLVVLTGNFLFPLITIPVSSVSFVVLNTLFESRLIQLKEFKRILKQQQDITYDELNEIDKALASIKKNLEKCRNLLISYDGKYKELEELEEIELVAPLEMKNEEELYKASEDGLVKLLIR